MPSPIDPTSSPNRAVRTDLDRTPPRDERPALPRLAEPFPAVRQPRCEVLTNVPAARVEGLLADFKSEGASTVAQGLSLDGTWSVAAYFTSTPCLDNRSWYPWEHRIRRREALTHVPNAEVNDVVRSFASEGATKISQLKQHNRQWTVVASFT